MFHRTQSAALFIAACLSTAAQAETVCSKTMLRNSYGFAGTASGYTTALPGGTSVSCAFGGVMTFDANDGVTIRKLSEVCASTQTVLTATLFNQATDANPTAGTYTLDPATCTAKVQFTSSGSGAFLQLMFTDNAQELHFTLERVGGNYGVAGIGTGSRL
jgi:hypothetical protein